MRTKGPSAKVSFVSLGGDTDSAWGRRRRRRARCASFVGRYRLHLANCRARIAPDDQGLASLIAAASFSHVHPLNPKAIAAGDLDGSGQDDAVVDFGPQMGPWIKWNNTTWTQLHVATADVVIVGQALRLNEP